MILKKRIFILNSGSAGFLWENVNILKNSARQGAILDAFEEKFEIEERVRWFFRGKFRQGGNKWLGKCDKSDVQMKNSQGWHYFLELLVVVFGILIAFVLNNWHENFRNARAEREYLISLRNDLQQDKTQLDSLIQFSHTKIAHLKRLNAFLTPRLVNQDSTLILFSSLLKLYKFDAHRATFEALKNSGDFNLISSYPLKKKIVDYYQTLSAKKHFDDILDTYFNTYIVPFAFKKIDFRAGRFLHTQTFLTPYTANLILGYQSLLTQSVDFYTKLRGKCQSLLRDLNQTP